MTSPMKRSKKPSSAPSPSRKALKRPPLYRRLPSWAVKYLILGGMMTGCVWLWPVVSHKTSLAGKRLLTRAGFTVNALWVEGREHTPLDTLRNASQIQKGMFMGDVSLDALKARLDTLPWVEAVVITRKLPGTLTLTVRERKPLALWQDQGHKHLLDSTGKIIPCPPAQIPCDLILLSGKTAPEGAASLVEMLKTVPTLYSRVKGATRMRSGRWDLYLESTLLKLPRHDPARSLEKFMMLEKAGAVSPQQHEMIDLRLEDRVFLIPRLSGKNL